MYFDTAWPLLGSDRDQGAKYAEQPTDGFKCKTFLPEPRLDAHCVLLHVFFMWSILDVAGLSTVCEGQGGGGSDYPDTLSAYCDHIPFHSFPRTIDSVIWRRGYRDPDHDSSMLGSFKCSINGGIASEKPVVRRLSWLISREFPPKNSLRTVVKSP